MPFTLSHIVAVHPIRKKLPLDALVLGSIVPDTSYFLPLNLSRNDTHTIISMLTYSLPVGLLLLFIYRYILKVPLHHLLNYKQSNTRMISRRIYYLKPFIGLLTGAILHLIWDYLTHLPESTIFQHISSIIGLFILIVLLAKRRSRWSVKVKTLVVPALVLITSIITAIISLPNNEGSFTLWFIYWIIFFGGKILLSILIIYTLFYNIKTLVVNYRDHRIT